MSTNFYVKYAAFFRHKADKLTLKCAQSSRPNLSFPLKQVRALDKPPRALPFGDGEMMWPALAPTVDRMTPDVRCRILAALIKRVEIHVYILQLFTVVAITRGDQFQSIETSLFR